MERRVNERQLSVLQWVGAGCPAGVWDTNSYKTTCQALHNRGLVTVSSEGRAVERRPDERRPALPGTRHVPSPRITPAEAPGRRSTPQVHPSAGKVGHPAEAKPSITVSRNVHGAAVTGARGGRRQDRQERQRSRLGEVAVPRRRGTQIRKDSGDEGAVRKLVP